MRKKIVTIEPCKSKGEINIHSSKSLLHRYIICSSLSEGISIIKKSEHNFSLDILSTFQSLSDVGLIKNTYYTDNKITIEGNGEIKDNQILHVRESAATLRFLIPIISAFGVSAKFICDGSLASRTLLPYKKIYDEKNMFFKQDKGIINVSGKLTSGIYKIEGDISSQFISGLIFALSLVKGYSSIVIENYLESKNYVLLTIDTLKYFGVYIDYQDSVINIEGRQTYKGSSFFIEGDYSYASFFIAGFALGGGGLIQNLNLNSLQGDIAIIEIAKSMNIKIDKYENCIKVYPCENIKPIDIDIKDIPDLAPVLVLLACASNGVSRIFNAKRLRLKESDRIDCLAKAFKNIGANIETKEDEIIVYGKGNLIGGATESYNDHRIAMAIAMASNICYNSIQLNDYECVKKSSMEFWDEFANTCGQVIYPI